MDGKRIEGNEVYDLVMCVSILLFALIVVSQPISADKSQVEAWFNGIIKPVKESGKTLDPELVEAKTEPRIIKVMQGGGGEFDTITKSIESIPSGNAKPIRPGSYKEKIRIERNKPFITLVGDPKNMPNLTFDGTAKQYGTIDSATLITESSYFVGANLNIVNTAPRPDGKMVGAQAVALRVSGDRGNHFFKDCHIRGTVDFIFGSGTSLYLNSKIFMEGDLEGDPEMAVITAQVKESSSENTGYSFMHGKITGTANDVFLGRAWKSSPRVVYSYTEMDEIVHLGGWSKLCTTENTSAQGKARLPLHERYLSNNYLMRKLNHSWFLTMLKVPNGCFHLQQYLINSFIPNLFMRAPYPHSIANSSRLTSTS
ncbi:hypothetical protein CXB51_032968 [Gossypium anomalum]|uniref:Pectinesterase n=1 Tax=Gossypium anomalum TaxID=47600 RepID=A0A8J5Y8L0_9ROSI|nr:hypothetical protein CXB51_032968 [Gossypium anomalum]